MDITFNCDQCGQNIVIDEAGAGLATECPKCGQPLTVPRQEAQHPKPITSPPAQVAASPSETKQCPFCAETIKREAKVCRFCGRDTVAEKSTRSPSNRSPLLWSLAIVILAVAVLGIGLWDRHQAEQTKLAKQQVEQTKLAKQQVERAKAEKQQAEKQKAEQEENDRQYAEWKRKSDKWWSVTKKIEARFDQLQQEYTTRDFSNCRSAHELDQEENRLLDKARTAETEIHDMMADMSSADFPGSFDLFKVVTEFFAHHRAMIGSDATLFHTVVMLGRWDDDWEKKAHEEHLACNKAMLALISVRGFSGLPFLPKKK